MVFIIYRNGKYVVANEVKFCTLSRYVKTCKNFIRDNYKILIITLKNKVSKAFIPRIGFLANDEIRLP